MNNELKFNTSKDQEYVDSWDGGKIRICKYDGKCILCGTRTYYFTDGGNDPRGPLGGHAASPLEASEYNMIGQTLPACFMCQNDSSEKYEHLLKIAKFYWKEPKAVA